jgi:hypothetical protein
MSQTCRTGCHLESLARAPGRVAPRVRMARRMDWSCMVAGVVLGRVVVEWSRYPRWNRSSEQLTPIGISYHFFIHVYTIAKMMQMIINKL